MRWLRRSVIGLVIMIGAAVLFVWTASSMQLARLDRRPLIDVRALTDAGAVARGERLSALYGCSGCHGSDLSGGDFVWDEPHVVTVHASNLTIAMQAYSDAELARAIRSGIDDDGRPLWAMPSESWVMVSDADMGDLLAYLRTQSPRGEPRPERRLGVMGRVGLMTGDFRLSPAYVADALAAPPRDVGQAFESGRYLASTVCSECHGSDLSGGDTPDLTLAAAYSLEHFTTLMRTGRPIDGRDLRMMDDVARSRFVRFTDAEITDLHAYLVARAEAEPY